MTLFNDFTNEFKIIDYSPTHNQLLIRSLKNKSREYNIDILIKGVLGMFILTDFNGLEISINEITEDSNYLSAKNVFNEE